ncbi:hypothetical protein OIU85_008140 [Salix viminalis]|uniref:Uncharacterized protein n=1 Tax=Salix viminalis TaxID=40686 RepID=A0A9Q0SHT2_SALVM|nr:hypothetical protein OIU85_008140 [Salix viminalis]
MEGLIPLVYKAFRKKKTRSHYECLSSGAALSYNISNFYIHEAPKSELHLEPSIQKKNSQKKDHQRSWSVQEDFTGGFSSLADRSAAAASPRNKETCKVQEPKSVALLDKKVPRNEASSGIKCRKIFLIPPFHCNL